MSTKRSPAPWTFTMDDEESDDPTAILDKRGIVIARVEGESDFREQLNGGKIEGPGSDCSAAASDEQDANGRLIAAAPDLLEACRGVEDVYREMQSALPLLAKNPAAFDLVTKAVQQARAAIAKAEGR